MASALGGIRVRDVGEVLSLAAPLGIFVPLVLYGYFKSDASTREASRRFFVLIALLGAFGVFIDMLHEFRALKDIEYALGYIEESGEMVVMSVIAVYATSLIWACRAPGPDKRRDSTNGNKHEVGRFPDPGS